VAAFQHDVGLTADGLAGRVTRAALKTRHAAGTVASDTGTATESSPTTTTSGILRNGSRGADVQRVQALLTTAGYAPGPADGIFGPKTELAVLAFQDEHGLRVDGLVGPSTRAALGF
jgi:peptidoglycan hydrolase-like protein with peptidoglycan-binding domain